MALLRVIVVLVASLLTLQGEALAQAGKVYRVGLVGAGAPDVGLLGPTAVNAFAKRGYVADQNILFERRAGQGKARLTACPGSSTNSSPTMST